MAELIKKNQEIVILAIGLLLTALGLLSFSGLIVWPTAFATSTATKTIVVTAVVQESLTFSVSVTSTTLTPDLVDTAGNAAIGSSTNITLSLGTNAGKWKIEVNGADTVGMVRLGGSETIVSVSGTIATGTNGYGLNATTSYAGVTIDPVYNYWGTPTVGPATTTLRTLATKQTGNASATVATIKIYAAATSTQVAGNYRDTITLTATSPY